ncbi:MAG TPA: hypothetical protein DCF47_06390 [Kandleria vitulina]|jgi:hypothetical protein|nr:hypothetical protein [Kandleria vitulina]
MAQKHFSFDNDESSTGRRSSSPKRQTKVNQSKFTFTEGEKRRVNRRPVHKKSKGKFNLKKWQIALIVLAVLAIGGGTLLFVAGRDDGPVYGDRCKGILSLSTSVLRETETEMKNKHSSIENINISIQCKELRFDIKFASGTRAATAERIVKEAVKLVDQKAGKNSYSGSSYSELFNYSNKVRQFEAYIYMTCDGNSDFPIYGTKLAGKDSFSFTYASIKDESTYKKAKK